MEEGYLYGGEFKTVHILCNGLVLFGCLGIAKLLHIMRRNDKEHIFPWLYWVFILLLWVLGSKRGVDNLLFYWPSEFLALAANIMTAIITMGIFGMLVYFVPRAADEKIRKNIEAIRALDAERRAVEKMIQRDKKRIEELKAKIKALELELENGKQ